MIRKCALLLLLLLIITGCWDRRELNDRAIWLATGWDIAAHNQVQITGQVVIPTKYQSQSQNGDSSTGKKFFNVTEEGKNSTEIMLNMQRNLSREAFIGHRRIIFLSEKFAKHGIREHLDSVIREPDIGLRGDIFVIKGATALEALETTSALETPPALAVLKKQRLISKNGNVSLLEFVISSHSEGMRPTMPAIEIIQRQRDENTKILKLAGLGVFNDRLELLGYLDVEEELNLLWVKGEMDKRLLALKLDSENAGFDFVGSKSNIVTKLKNNNLKFDVKLTGEGYLHENNTNLNPDKPQDLIYLEKEFERVAVSSVRRTIKKVQQDFKRDVFGLGEQVHKKYPKEWQTLKNDWDQHFAKAEIDVAVDLTIRRTGLVGPNLFMKEGEEK